MLKRCTVIILALASMISASAVAGAQTNERADAIELFPVASPAARPLFTPDALDASIAQQPAGRRQRHVTPAIKAMAKHLVTNFKYLPSKENLYWAGAGGGLALAVHPFDDNVNEYLVGNDTAEKIFKTGEILGELGTLLGSASVVYAVGRIKDQPKVSHLGMDLIEALAMSEALTQTLKYTTRRERPDGSSKNSFPSGHAADTFAFATALERHLNWKYSIPAYSVLVLRGALPPAGEPPLAQRRGVRLGGRHHRGTHRDEPRVGASVSCRSDGCPRRHGHYVRASVQVIGPLQRGLSRPGVPILAFRSWRRCLRSIPSRSSEHATLSACVSSSPCRPMRRVKNGIRSVPPASPATSNTPAPSRKNVRFSGKNSGNRVRLTWRMSASVSAKSVLTVIDALRFGVRFLKTSRPPVNCPSPSSRPPDMYGRTSRPWPCRAPSSPVS